MENIELYEKLRVVLNFGSVLPFPKHETSYKLLTNLFNEEEAKIVAYGLKRVRTPVDITEIENSVGIPESELKNKLENMVYKGLIARTPSKGYMSLPYYPGILPNYYVYTRADTKNMKEISKASNKLMELSWIQELSDRECSNFRVIPKFKSTDKTITINETIEAETTILPFENLKEYINKTDPRVFTIVPCACRDSYKLAGHSCKRTKENFCIACGTYAVHLNSQGIGRQVDLDELFEILEDATKKGLVHQTTNIQESATIICNCCSCCCIYLKSFNNTGGSIGATAGSNFEPERNLELCTLCEKCSHICPTGAIYRHYPHRKDGTDDCMMIRSKLCLGCGVCASNCPEEAITLKKVRDDEPAAEYTEMVKKVSAGQRH